MLFESVKLPNQAIVPLGVALAHLALALFVIFNRRHTRDTVARLFLVYMLVTAIWNINLVLVVAGVPTQLPVTWAQFITYGFMALGALYWAFGRAFLQQLWRVWWVWLFTALGMALVLSLHMRWIPLSAEMFSWSNGWITVDNTDFIIGVIWWTVLMGLALISTIVQLRQTRNPTHRNRIQYLIITTLLLVVGYVIYLSLIYSFWTAGLIVTWLGSALGTYIVVEEDLLDLGTAIRRGLDLVVAALVTMAVYVAGIYLVQIFLGDFLASTFLTHFMSPTLVVAAVTALLLTIVYTPIRRLSRSLTHPILYGREYDFQTVIKNYSQKISNILYLDDLVQVALTDIKKILGADDAVLFLLDVETANTYEFRILPERNINGTGNVLTLTKNTPVTHRLVTEKQALAQYSVDISHQFKIVPEQEREVLHSLHFEWYVPILKQHELIGLFALGTKQSKRQYNATDLRLLTTLADQTALALENASLVDRLQRNLEETTRMKNLMNNVFDSMDNGVVTTDLVGRVTLFNKAAESILALPRHGSLIGRVYTQVMPSLAKTVFPNLVNNVIEHENHYADYEIISDIPERGRVNLNMNLAPLRDAENKTHGVTMVMDDITETKRLQAVQDMFRRYVSPAVVDRLPADASELELGGHRQQISVLFADIRGFTTFSEKLAPEALVDTLNEYLSMAAASILMYEGTLDKFMGDAVMGIFNAPLEQEDHVLRAVRAASAMQRAIANFHSNVGREEGCLSFGVGLHVGEAVVGNVGMSDRMDYTAIGDTVNLAKRIQENTPGGKILISDAVYAVVKDSVKAVFYQEMKVKGREQPVKTYELKQVS